MIPDTDLEASSAAGADEIVALCAAAHWCARRGWVPATSGNFSVRVGDRIHVTASGLDKGTLTPADLLELTADGTPVEPGARPSAEAGLHVVVYRERPEAHAILHVHTIWNTLLSGAGASEGAVVLAGYELLKALAGVATHEHVERVPVLANSQDYAALAAQLDAALKAEPGVHGVLLSQHGLYTWGTSVAEARRHLEALEFLFEVEGRRHFGGLL